MFLIARNWHRRMRYFLLDQQRFSVSPLRSSRSYVPRPSLLPCFLVTGLKGLAVKTQVLMDRDLLDLVIAMLSKASTWKAYFSLCETRKFYPRTKLILFSLVWIGGPRYHQETDLSLRNSFSETPCLFLVKAFIQCVAHIVPSVCSPVTQWDLNLILSALWTRTL